MDTVVEKVLERGYLGKNSVDAVKRYIFNGQQIRCCFCGKVLTREQATIEHIIPKSQAKYEIRNHIDNLAISCKRCNYDRITAEFYEFMAYVQKRADAPIGCKDQVREENKRKIIIDHDIVQMFMSGFSINQIQEKTRASKKTIKRHLMEKGLSIRGLNHT